MAARIEVIDDGAGVSTERVMAKAIERGLLTPEQADAVEQHQKEMQAQMQQNGPMGGGGPPAPPPGGN